MATNCEGCGKMEKFIANLFFTLMSNPVSFFQNVLPR
jgi:hypothetical protein